MTAWCPTSNIVPVLQPGKQPHPKTSEGDPRGGQHRPGGRGGNGLRRFEHLDRKPRRLCRIIPQTTRGVGETQELETSRQVPDQGLEEENIYQSDDDRPAKDGTDQVE